VGNQYAIEPATLRRAATGLGAASEELSTQWTNLLATVNGMGAPWGGDDIGMLIDQAVGALLG
jgi:citrate lyase beta subunit